MERRKFRREFKLEAVRLIKDRGVSYAQASQDLNVHTSQLRDWVKKFSDDPEQAFPGNGQMKPEQLEIAQLAASLQAREAVARPSVPRPGSRQTGTPAPKAESRRTARLVTVRFISWNFQKSPGLMGNGTSCSDERDDTCWR